MRNPPWEARVQQPSDPKREFASLFVLIAANLVPVAGAVLWHWQVTDVIFLYWFENILVGAFYVLRILLTDPDTIPPKRDGTLLTDEQIWMSKLGFGGVYALVYGAVCFGNAIFLVAFFHPPNQPEAVLGTLVAGLLRERGAYGALLAILAAHAVAFCRSNPFSRRPYSDEEKLANAAAPFLRSVVTSPMIFVGGFALLAFEGDQLVPMVLLIAVKIGIEVGLHRIERPLAAAS